MTRGRLFDWRRTARSFQHAGRGLREALASEPNLRIHALLGVGALLLAWLLGFSILAIAAVAVATGLVLTAELFNTALERFVDRAWPEPDPLVRFVKDTSAAAVLVAAATAALVGLLLLGRRILYGSV